MVRPGRYDNYMRLTSPAGGESRLEVIRLVPKTEHFVEIPLYLYLSGSDGSDHRVAVQDFWVRVGGKWYHVARDPILLREAS